MICALLLREKLATEKMENKKKNGKKREDNGESTIPLNSSTLLPKKLRWLLKIKVPSKGKALDTRSQENVQKALVET